MNTLSDAEWAVMEVLWERDSCTLGEISERLAIDGLETEYGLYVSHPDGEKRNGPY